MNASTRTTLELFEQKASKLTRSGFMKELMDKPVTVTYQRGENDRFTVTTVFPNDELRDAFVLTFRMLIQDNDSISIRNLSKLTADTGLSARFREIFDEFRTELNRFLEDPGLLAGFTEMGVTTHHNLLRTFVYGDMAHTGKERTLYLSLNSDHLFPIIELMFIRILGEFMRRVERLLEIVRLELAGEPIPLWVKSVEPLNNPMETG